MSVCAILSFSSVTARKAALCVRSRVIFANDNRARWVTYRVNDDIDPKPFAVFAHAPPGALETTRGARNLKRANRLSRTDIILSEEDTVISPDDFLSAIAFDALGAGVPAFHRAVEVQEINRIVDDVVNKHFRREVVLGRPCARRAA
jgi:hypothetical protein